LPDDLTKQCEREETSWLEFVSEVSYRYEKEWYVRNVAFKQRGWFFLLKTLLESEIFLVLLSFILLFNQ